MNCNVQNPEKGFIVDPDIEDDLNASRQRTISDSWEAPNIELLKPKGKRLNFSRNDF